MRKFRVLSLSLAALLAVVPLSVAQSATAVVATVNGENITEQQLLQTASANLAKLDADRPQPQAAYDRARLEVLWMALTEIVEDRLISAAVARFNITRDQLIYSEVESNVETPSDAEVEEYYEVNKAQIPVPKAQALPIIRQGMIDSSRRHYREMLINNLRNTFKVTTTLDPLRTDVATEGHPAHGPANAPVTLVEFADFECPYCGGLYPTLKLVGTNYADKVRFVFRQLPLSNIHPHAQKAAEASLCANEQQRFWEFHDSLFGDQAHLDVPSLQERAKTLKLDTAQFNACLDSGKMAAAIDKDREAAVKAGVSSTPTMFINGRLLPGNRTYAEIREIIEDELRRAGQQ